MPETYPPNYGPYRARGKKMLLESLDRLRVFIEKDLGVMAGQELGLILRRAAVLYGTAAFTGVVYSLVQYDRRMGGNVCLTCPSDSEPNACDPSIGMCESCIDNIEENCPPEEDEDDN